MDMFRVAFSGRVEADCSALAIVQESARAALLESRRLSEELCALKTETRDMYFHLQQRLDNNYETITDLERSVIERRVDFERASRKHAERMAAWRDEQQHLLNEAKQERNELLKNEIDSSEREAVYAKLRGLKEEVGKASISLREEMAVWHRERLRKKEFCRKELEEAIREENDKEEDEDKLNAQLAASSNALSESGRKVAELHRESSRLRAKEAALRRSLSLEKEAYRVARVDFLAASRRPEIKYSKKRPSVKSNRPLPKDKERVLADLAKRRARIFDCVIALLLRASHAARNDTLSSNDDVEKNKILLINHLIRTAHAYRVDLHQSCGAGDVLAITK